VEGMDTNLLARLIEVKHGLLVQLQQLAARQQEWVSQGDMARLLNLLAAKQHLLGELQRVEQGLDPFRAEDPDGRRWRSPEDRQRCREQAAACETLLTEIMNIERQCESELIQRRDRTEVVLQGLHHAEHASRAYFAPSESNGRQIDLSCET
jgi:hypothetical protein